MPREFWNFDPLETSRVSSLPPLDLVVEGAISIVKFLMIAEKAGEISHEQSNRLAKLVYVALQNGGYNLPLLNRDFNVSPRYETKTPLQVVFAPEAPGPAESIEAPILPIEAPVDPIYEWINVQGGLDNVLKAIQKNGWADTSSWEKDGRKFTVADIKKLGKT